jgi:hypothetical protein
VHKLPDDAHAFGSRALAAVAPRGNLVFDALTDLEAIEEPSFNRGMVKKDVGSVRGLDKTESSVADQLLDLPLLHDPHLGK